MSEGADRAAAIFAELVALPGEARARRLEQVRAESATLGSEVESLLSYHQESESEDSFLDAEALRRAAWVSASRDLEAGARVGSYTVMRKLGAGGMGVVYLAQQARPRRPVALKLLAGALVSPVAMRRFEREAEMLARLQHPGIALVYEAGTSVVDGVERAFIALEFVDGPPLTEFATRAGLGVRERMELFVAVCTAVQHAHERGVIHRDLKPANILVNAEGGPKILDFGIARALDSDMPDVTLHTDTGQMLGTLAYMSPEQVGGRPEQVDTRADVYALGVLMYELITGQQPIPMKGRSLAEAARAICEQEPVPLAVLRPELAEDLGAIATKALAKKSEARYPSAAALAADVVHYLSGEPISLRQATAMRALTQGLRRYQLFAAAGVLVLVCMVFVAALLAVQTRAAREVAGREREALVIEQQARGQADRDARALTRGLYFSNIGFAQAAHITGDAERMRGLLEECPENLRGWEWSYLRSIADQSVRTLRVAEQGPFFAAMNSAGTGIATVASRDTITFLTPETSAPRWVHRRTGGEDIIDMSPDGRLVATAWRPPDGRSEVQLLSATDGRVVRSIGRDGQWAGLVAFSKDSSRLAILEYNGAGRLVSLTGGADVELESTSKTPWYCAAWSPDSGIFAGGGWGNRIVFWDASSGRIVRVIEGHEGPVRGLAFSPDGARLLSGSNDLTARVWDVKTGEEMRVLSPQRNKLTTVDWSPDGQRIAMGGTDASITVYDTVQFRPLATLRGHDFTLSNLRFTPDPDMLISAARDGTVKFWRLSAAGEYRRVTTTGLERGPTALDVSPDGQTAVIGMELGTVVLCRPDGFGARVVTAPGGERGRVLGVVFVDSGSVLVADTQAGLARLTADTGAPIWKRDDALVGGYVSVAPSPDRTRYVVAAHSGAVSVGDLSDGAGLTEVGRHPTGARGVAWVDDSLLVSCGEDGTLRFWNEGGGEAGEVKIAPNILDRVLVAPGGEEVYVSDGYGHIHAVSVKDRAVRQVMTGHKGPVYTLTMDATGTRLASGGFDNTIRLWDPESGKLILVLQGHTLSVTGLRFGPRNDWLLSVGQDGMRSWHTTRAGGETGR
jgi:WD40 repeat protein/predicted Ser/Thr protein kinase